MAKAFGGLGTTAGLAADRAAMTGMSAGQAFFETDTKLVYIYDGTSWVRYNSASANFAAKGGPSSFSSAYKNVFSLSVGVGPMLSHNTYNYGILVNTTGYYECRAGQRIANSGDAYIGIGLNGDRTALESRSTGIWSHGHAGYNNIYTESYYIGLLNANEIVTMGPASSTSYLLYAANGYAGFLSVKFLGF